MDFLIEAAHAQAAGGQESTLSLFLPLLIFVGVFYFLLIRPQQKRAKEHREMVSALGVGDEVVTSGGILGKITELGEQFVALGKGAQRVFERRDELIRVEALPFFGLGKNVCGCFD